MEPQLKKKKKALLQVPQGLTLRSTCAERVSKGIASAGPNPGSENAQVTRVEPERLLLPWKGEQLALEA